MTTAATPGEFEALMAQLEPLREQMRKRKDPETGERLLSEQEITQKLVAIVRLDFEIVGLCPGCNEPIRRCDARRLVEDELAHVSCIEGSD
jgi:hypothetical protein